MSEKKKVSKKSTKPRTAAKSDAGKSRKVKLLSGGNPQIAKAYGEAPVQQYIAAMPGWKSELGKKIDAIITKVVPDVFKAVKWNSPFYGFKVAEEKGEWFLGLHCMTKYVKVAFFHGTELKPVPPGASKQARVRYLDIYEDDEFNEELFADWVKQASNLPLEKM